MDSLTQIVLGAAVGEATLGRKVGNKALLWGAIAGTIPDLDVVYIKLIGGDAIDEIVRLSGKSMGAVDFYFFGARLRCPEMSEPQCELCSLDPICAKRKELFQPVVRTTFY